MMSTLLAAKPAHVRDDVVADFDYTAPPGIGDTDVYTAWGSLHNGPDIIWTPHHGGHWVVTRADDIKWVQRTYEIFSHEVFMIPPPPKPMDMPPVTADPPNHAKYRVLINPAFTPSSVRQSGEVARELTRSLIEEYLPRGHCEFVHDFAYIMPVTVFLRMIDLPLDQRQQFIEWATGYVSGSDATTRQALVDKILAYLGEVVKERMHNRGADLISRILEGDDKNKFASEREMLGMIMLVFLGGLDTVANLLSFTVLHLAQNDANRRRLVDDPAVRPAACEEIFRRFGLSNTGRLVKVDTDYKGVTFKAGDMVMVPIGMSSLDDRVYENPFAIDFDRPNAKVNNTFGNGPHACPGMLLARAELTIFLDEWLARIPEFWITPGDRPQTKSGLMNAVKHLPISWAA